MSAFIPPTPVPLPPPSLWLRTRRLGRTVSVITARLAPVAARKLLRKPEDRVTASRALRASFEELGATYVKFGQFLASAPAIVTLPVAEEFRGTLDRGPGVSYRQIRAIFHEDTGQSIDEAFASFEKRPFAAASMAVVHRAVLKDGRTVAVKFIRPNLAETVSADLGIMLPAFKAAATLGGNEGAFALVGYLVGLRQQLAEELDLRNEARSMAHFGRLFAEFGLDLLVVPTVHEALSGQRVLTMEYLDGVAIDNLEGVEKLGIDPKSLVRELLRAWILTAIHNGIFHADIHAGNLLALPDGRLGMLDWGIVAQLDKDSHLLMRNLVKAALGDEEAWGPIKDATVRIQGTGLRQGFGLTDEEIGRMVRAMLEPILTLPLKDVSMATLFAGTDEVMALATGRPVEKRSRLQKFRTNRRTAKAYRLSFKSGYFDTSFQRSNFLASKQLVYLERYGRMYVPEHAILGDHEFLEGVMARANETDAGASAAG